MGVQGCTAPPYFKMDCGAPPNFGIFVSNEVLMGVQNKVPNKDMHPCFQIPNTPTVDHLLSNGKKLLPIDL